MASLLQGIRVLDLGRMLAAPTATQLLADFGAEVIKIERPGRGDDNRRLVPPELKGAHSAVNAPLFVAANRGKKSVTLDLSSSEGQAIVRELAKHSDVMVENFKPGDLARKGLDYESIRAINPDIVYCSLTAFGQTGPLASGGGIDSVFQAMSGVMGVTGEPDSGPLKVGFFIGDVLGGLYAAIAILGALLSKQRGGRGQSIDISMVETMIAALGHHYQSYLMTGTVPPRMGNGSAEGSVPIGAFRCTDGYVQVSAVGQDRYALLCNGLDRPDLLTNPRYATPESRIAHKAETMGVFQDIFATESCMHWVNMLAPKGVIIARINTIPEALAEPQMVARQIVREVTHPASGPMRMIANPIRFSATPVDYKPSPMLGEDSAEVLRNLLGYDEARIGELREAGVL